MGTRPRNGEFVARVLLGVWLGGTTILTAGVVLAPTAHASTGALWMVSGIGYAFAAALWLGRRRLPTWTPDASGYLLNALVTAVAIASHDPASPYALFYVWVTLASCNVVPVRRAIPQIAVAPACYGLALVLIGDPFPWLQWSLMGVTVWLVGLTVVAVRRRVKRLISLLADTARTDTLTQLRNRRSFDESLEVELERAARTGHPVSLLLGDIDFFKTINDRFGHPTGDLVLRDVASAISAAIRSIDLAARVGGEEFAVLAPGTDTASAHLLAERIRRHVAISVGVGSDRVRLSFGVAAYPEHGPDATALTAAADAALYLAKARGRDRTVSAPAPLDARPTQRLRAQA